MSLKCGGWWQQAIHSWLAIMLVTSWLPQRSAALTIKAYFFGGTGRGPLELGRSMESAMQLVRGRPNLTLDVCRGDCNYSRAAFKQDLSKYDLLWFEGKQFLQPDGDLLTVDPDAVRSKVVAGEFEHQPAAMKVWVARMPRAAQRTCALRRMSHGAC